MKMTRLLARILILSACLSHSVFQVGSQAAEDENRENAKGSVFASQILELSELVMSHHVDPPARQQMVLAAAKRICASLDRRGPADLSRTVSALTSTTEFERFLTELFGENFDAVQRRDELFRVATEGILSVVSGDPQVIPGKEFRVQQQLAGNRYVGIGIVLGVDEKKEQPRIMTAFDSGPAHRAGLISGTHILEVDGTKTAKRGQWGRI